MTLQCFRLGHKHTEAIIWYKQKPGHEPHVMATVHQKPNYENDFKPPKFNVEKEEMGCHLKITEVEPSDEAMYYCGTLNYEKVFGKGTFLSVKGMYFKLYCYIKKNTKLNYKLFE